MHIKEREGKRKGEKAVKICCSPYADPFFSVFYQIILLQQE